MYSAHRCLTYLHQFTHPCRLHGAINDTLRRIGIVVIDLLILFVDLQDGKVVAVRVYRAEVYQISRLASIAQFFLPQLNFVSPTCKWPRDGPYLIPLLLVQWDAVI